jgi:hypothetical protein
MMTVVRILLVGAVLLVSACRGGSERASQSEKAGAPLPPSTSSPTSAAPGGSEAPAVELQRFRIGRAVGSDGLAAEETDVYKAGDSVNVTFRIAHAPVDSQAMVVFKKLPDQKIGEERKALNPGTGDVAFASGETRRWSPGDYRVDMYLVHNTETRLLGTHDFKIAGTR